MARAEDTQQKRRFLLNANNQRSAVMILAFAVVARNLKSVAGQDPNSSANSNIWITHPNRSLPALVKAVSI